MASELVYLLELIAEAVVFVLKRTIDLVCALLYVVSILPPWRAIEELFNPRRFDEGYDDYWGYCARSFFLTLFDVIALPMGLISVPNPLRWSSLAIIFRRYFNSTNSDYMWELRGSLFFSGLICLLGMLCFPFGVAAMLMGVRSFVVVRESALHLPQIMRPVGDSLDSIKELELDINWVFFTQFWMSLLDVLVFSVSLPFVACSLHLWKSWSDGIPRLRSKYLTRFEEEYFNSRMNSYGDFYGDLRLFFFNKIVQVLLDIAALPFACFALLSPIRNSVFRNSCSKNGLNWCVCAKPPDVVEIQQQDIVEEDSTSYKPSPEQVLFYDTVHLEFNYNIQIRLDAFYYGLLSFSDVLLLPFLVPLCVTWYRFRPVQTQLVSAESWGCKQISTVSFQTMLLMFDLLILPCNAVIFLTRFRWNPVRLKYEEDDLCSMKSFATYGAIIRSFLLLCLDVIVCPFTFFVLITHYRSSSPWLILKTQSVYNGPMNRALIFHCSVLIQFFIVVHDIFLMFPAFLFSSLFFYRSIHMVRLPKTALVEPAAIDAVAEDTLSELCILNRLADMTTDGLEWRCYMWVEIFSIPLDVLTILLPSIIVVGTLWRAPALIYSIVAIDKSYKKKLGDISGAVVTPVERMCRFELYWIIRRCALKQVCLLMLDILCLVPFCIIIGSLYRLPGVILQLFAKFHETKHLSLRLHNAVVSDPDSATVEPLLKCSSVRMEFPERGGPRVIVRATRNTAAPSDTIETADSPTIAPICFAAPAVAKMHVLGKLFWRIVEQVFGSTASSVGKSMLPLILRDGAGISLEAISTQLNIGVEEAIGEIEFWVQFDAGNTKRSTIVKNIQKMYNGVRAVPVYLALGFFNTII